MSESDSAAAVAGALLSVLLFASFMYIVSTVPFPGGSYVHSELIPTNPPSRIGGAMSTFLWNFRGLDLLIQTIVLFTTAVCCLALLREEK
jgi:multisubunit Na+/H+ antiporter MnhB subunit